MSNTFKIKRGSGKPSDGTLKEGELGFDKTNKLIYIGGSDGKPICLNEAANTTYKFATGDNKGQIKITPPSGEVYNVSVNGLDTAAYTSSAAYATAAQGIKADNALPATGGTLSGIVTITNNSSLQSAEPHLKWKTVGSNTPYIGFAQDQTDGTFLICSLKGVNYQTGLAIGGGSGNLLWKGAKVATVSDIPSIPTSLKNPNSLTVKGNGAQSFTYDGSAARTLDIKAGLNISVSSDTSGNITINATDTTYSNATTSAAGLMSATDKSKLDGIAEGANNYTYTLPNATSSVLGGVKIGSNISVSSGVISLTKTNITSALGYTPPTTDTTYSNATTSAAGLMSAADKTKLEGIADNANNYSLPAATTSKRGGVKIGDNITVSSGTISLTNANVTGALGYTPLYVANDSENSQAKVDINITEPYSFHLQITNNTGTTPHSCSIFQGSTNNDNRGIGIYDARNNKVAWVYNDNTQSLAINVPTSLSDNVVFNNGKGIRGNDSSGAAQYLMFLSTSNTLQFGYNMPSTYTAKFNIPISGTLHLSGTTDASSTANNNAALIIGNRSGEHLVFDGNEIIPKSGATSAGTLYLGDSESTIISISGAFRLNSYSYGASLPSNPFAGRVFFLKV